LTITKKIFKSNRIIKQIHLQNPDEKARKLKELTQNTENNGIGDVEAVSEVLKSIGISEKFMKEKDSVIGEKMTENIVNTVSNLVNSNLRIAKDRVETQSAGKIGDRCSAQLTNSFFAYFVHYLVRF
jgi:hypothetical protein